MIVTLKSIVLLYFFFKVWVAVLETELGPLAHSVNSLPTKTHPQTLDDRVRKYFLASKLTSLFRVTPLNLLSCNINREH